MALTLFCLSLNFSGLLHGQFFQTIAIQERYNVANVNDQIYVHTDCEVYVPGDTIWFKAYIRKKASLEFSDLSKVFHIALVSEDGVIVKERKFVISNSQSNGFLSINGDVEQGVYNLVCYSSWMKNFDCENVYRKKILIEPVFKEGHRYVPHFDKISYLPGDTVKALVKCYDKLNKQIEGSKFKYTLLVDERIVEKGNGITTEVGGPLSFIINDSIESIPILNIWDTERDTKFKVPMNMEILVDFFPEGGNCLNNEMGVVAFKAEYASGDPVTIAGDIVDEQGNLLSSILSEHNGMGKFLFFPQKDKKYFLKITEPGGYNNLYELPEGQANAWAIQARTMEKKILVEIRNNTANFDTCLLMMSIRGYSYYYKLIPSETHSSFTIPTPSLPAGIAVLTLLNKDKIPQSERLVFVNKDRIVASSLKTDRSKYLTRDLVKLQIDVKNGDLMLENGDYSLSVFDDVHGNSLMIDEPNIISSNYLSPEIKGIINNPNYYFLSSSTETDYNLDLLLMTQGWRSYKYLEYYSKADSIKLPQNQDVIKGSLQHKKNFKTITPVEGNILVYFAGTSEKIPTDKQGNFSFIPEYTSDYTSSIVISATDKNGSDDVILNLEDFGFKNNLEQYLIESYDSTQSTTLLSEFLYEEIKKKYEVNTRNSIWIEEVEVRHNKNKKLEDPNVAMIKVLSNVRSSTPSLLQTSFEIIDVLLSMGYNCYEEGEALMVYYQGGDHAIKFIVDGIDRGTIYHDVSTFNRPSNLKNIYVVTGYEAVVVYGSKFVVYLQTDKEKYLEEFVDNTPNSKIIKNLQVVKEFYSPRYKTEKERMMPIPDIRKTIYWEPNIKLNKDGETLVQFYNSDKYTKIRCVLEGITDSGIPVYHECYYDISVVRK